MELNVIHNGESEEMFTLVNSGWWEDESNLLCSSIFLYLNFFQEHTKSACFIGTYTKKRKQKATAHADQHAVWKLQLC